MKSILAGAISRLGKFDTQGVRRLVAQDTIALDTLGDEKAALFIVLSDTDTSRNFLAAMMFQQLFDVLCYKADNEYGGRLPFHVRFLMDEFANCGQIPSFHVLISTIRSREISVSIILQNLAQIKNLYKETWEVITGNCDSFLFLGGNEQSTLEYVSKMLGKTTIDNKNATVNKGQSGSFSLQSQILGRELLMPDEVGSIPGRECILKIRNCPPFRSRKYDIEAHANYRQLSDADERNRFDITQREAFSTANFEPEKACLVTAIELDIAQELNALAEA